MASPFGQSLHHDPITDPSRPRTNIFCAVVRPSLHIVMDPAMVREAQPWLGGRNVKRDGFDTPQLDTLGGLSYVDSAFDEDACLSVLPVCDLNTLELLLSPYQEPRWKALRSESHLPRAEVPDVFDRQRRNRIVQVQRGDPWLRVANARRVTHASPVCWVEWNGWNIVKISIREKQLLGRGAPARLF
jgi:hypothetical protein